MAASREWQSWSFRRLNGRGGDHVRQLRYPFDQTMIDGRSAATHSGADGPSMVVIAVEEERTVFLLSYALTVPELRTLAETETRFLDEAVWLDAVG
jgi:hypothetical protein